MRGEAFPFDAVVGQDDAKLALRLAAADPLIGGVLLRGEKGSGKTTLARGLAALLADAPFVELPVGATEDRLVGTLDTRAALAGGDWRFEPGLLAAADGGVLYVDEINLLPDHLVDVLLDVAVSGENVVERDGISHRHPARFVLVGSMNPEEGELRPQLLDRFGLCVEVAASRDVADRVLAVRRRLAFDAGKPMPGGAVPGDSVPGDSGASPATESTIGPKSRSAIEPHNPRSGHHGMLPATSGAHQNGGVAVPGRSGAHGLLSATTGAYQNDGGEVPGRSDPGRAARADAEFGDEGKRGTPGVASDLVEAAARLALAAGAEGLRADLTLCRAAAALAALDGRVAPTTDDLLRVAPLVLAHRSRRGPFDPPVLSRDALDNALHTAGLTSDEGADPSPVGQHQDAEGADRNSRAKGPTVPSNEQPGERQPQERQSQERQSPAQPSPAQPSPPQPSPDDRVRFQADAAPTGGAGGAGGADGARPTDRRAQQMPVPLGAARAVELPRPDAVPSPRGRVVGDERAGPIDQVAVLPTLRAAASRRSRSDAAGPTSAPGVDGVEPEDLRTPIRVQPVARTIVLCVDVSGSMGADARAEAATGMALGLLATAYERRDKVGLVTFGGDGARAVLMPTSSIEVARNRLDDLVVGGETPLADGLGEALRVARQATRRDGEALLVVLTDGRASGPSGFDAAVEAAAAVGRAGIESVVLDCETGPRPLGLAPRLADAMGARYVPATDLQPTTLVRSITGA